MEHESDGDANCNWRTWYSHQRISKGAGRLRNQRTGGDHPKYSIIEIGQSTKKSPGDLRGTCCYSISCEKLSKEV